MLLEAGVDIDARDPHGWKALHMAAECGNIHIIVTLVEKGADLDAVVCEGGCCG
jgi:ankyrin repeat protein